MKQISAASSYSIPLPPSLIVVAMPYAYLFKHLQGCADFLIL